MFRSMISFRLLLGLPVLLLLAACNGNGDAPAAAGASSAVSTAAVSGQAAAGDNACDSGDPASADDPCVISTVEQLQEIDSKRDGHYALGSDIDASGTTGWNDGKGFRPIMSFSGSLDGRGFSVSGLVIDRPDDNNIGLFGEILEGAIIQNLSVLDANITGELFVAALAGSMRGGEISQVHVDAVVTGEGRVGGVVGSLHEGAAVAESSTRGLVTGTADRIGGLVGQHAGEIRHSYSLAAVHGGVAVGGLVGRASGRVAYSYSTVGTPDAEEPRITGNHGTPEIGGLVGVIEAVAEIHHSYTVSFAGSSQTVDFLGHRLVGRNWGEEESINESYWGGNRGIPLDSTDGARKVDDMKHAGSFDGWDFTEVWTIAEGEDYPDLRVNPRY